MNAPVTGGLGDPTALEGAEDADLLQRHVDGDPDAFGVLFRRHRDRLWAVALRTTGNPEDAADGLQDGMIAAFRRADSFRGDSQVTTWLHRVVVNACLDRMRAAKVRRAEALPDDLDDHGDRRAVVGTDRSAVDPADLAVADERRRQVLDALGQLPAEQRAALVLVDMEGYPVADVAEMLGCAVGTVKSRCSRGRARLADLLAPLGLLGRAPAGDPDHAPAGNREPEAPVPPADAPRGPPPPVQPPSHPRRTT